jgi:hypothetical protein
MSGVEAAVGMGVVGGLFAFNVIAGAVALSAIDDIGTIASVIALLVVIAAAIEGAEERKQLNNAIREMARSRVDIQTQLLRAHVLIRWTVKFRKF